MNRKTVKTAPKKVKTPVIPFKDPAELETGELRVSDGLLAQLGSAMVVRRPVTAYKPPPGVIPDADTVAKHNAYDHGQKPYLAMDAVPSPGQQWFGQAFAGLGFPGYAYLSELSQRSEYRAPSETIAKEMTRKWIKFISRSKDPKAADKFKKLEAAFKRFDVRQVWRKVLELDLFMGRAQIYISLKNAVDDDQVKSQPLTIDAATVGKGDLMGFKVIEPIWTSPLTYNSNDATAADFYQPQAWYVLGKRIHNTRLITVISRPVPDMLKPSYNFGGISLTQLMEPYVLRWLKTVDSVNRIISNFSVMILKSNLGTILQGKTVDGVGIIGRAKLFTLTRDNQGVTLLDKNSEEMQQIAVPLGGLSELQAQAQEHMAAPSHVPLVKLTGITPSGLNASSEGEITVFHEFIGAEQEDSVEPGLDIMFDLIQLNEFGAIDEDLDYEFVPLVESTTKEVSEIRKGNAEMVGTMIDKGMIDADEGREFFRTDPDSGWAHLVGDAPEPPEPQTDPNVIDPETQQPYAPPKPEGGDDK